MAWSNASTQGQQSHILNQPRASPPRSRRKYDCRLLSPTTVANGNTTFPKKALAGSGNPPSFTERNNLLIACGKQCVLSERPYRCPLSANKAETERSKKAEESERGGSATNRSLDEQRARSGTKRLEERARSSVGRRRVMVMSIRRPATAPACAQTGQEELMQPRPETPSCRLVWRASQGEQGQLGSPDSTSRGTPVLHLYLPSYQLTDTAHKTVEDNRLEPKLAKQQDNAGDTSQQDFTEDKVRQEIMIERWNENKESAQHEDNARNEKCDRKRELEEKNDQSDFIEDNGRPDIPEDSPPQAVTEGEGKGNKKDELAEDKRQREVTQGNIIEGEENEQHDIREDVRHNDYIEDVKQLDITKEHGTAEENRQQGCGESSGADDTVDNIKGSSELEPDLEMTVLESCSDHKEPIKTHKNKLPQTSIENSRPFTAMQHEQVLEKREKAPPKKLKSGLRTSCSLDQRSETNSPRRITHPTSVIVFPSPFTHTHSSPSLHMLPSFYGTSFGYRLRMLHTPQPHRAKTWTTRVSLDKRAIKSMKELPESKETKGNVSKMEARRITGPRPKIMSSEWGAPACKMKTTKTFVWGPRGPQETKSVCELHTNRCDGAAV
ncbi:uncharacterized protein LOC119262781 [Pygocentrus nattereri]|uniref:uncharacterized protein LOC119262781 n=1 Tax=Pygocentrus nattereri TaxID=42514 RepID=UPI001891669B|nr:uncharacterized protein LOC119262781 [Pygocentrus nattereri]